MGTGKVAKKRSSKGKGKADNAEKDILKEQLTNTGPFILRDFCRQHGMDPDDAKTFPKTKLISFLMGQFKEGELTLNDLYPDKEGKKSGSKAKSKAKSEPEEEPEDDGNIDGDDDDDDGAGDDDLDDDDLDLELDDDEDGDDAGGDDDDLEDESSDELDELDDDGEEEGGSDDAPDISILEDKIDKLMDLNSKVSKSLDLLVQLQLEQSETMRQGLKVLFKLGKVKNPGKLLKQIESKARKFAGIGDGDDDELEDE